AVGIIWGLIVRRTRSRPGLGGTGIRRWRLPVGQRSLRRLIVRGVLGAGLRRCHWLGALGVMGYRRRRPGLDRGLRALRRGLDGDGFGYLLGLLDRQERRLGHALSRGRERDDAEHHPGVGELNRL